MKINKLIIIFLALCLTICGTNAYLFGIKSFDNTTNNISQIESKYDFDIPIVAFIFDPWSNDVSKTLNSLNETLGNDKIYHISISPDKYSAQEVSEGKFDAQYIEFFSLIKENNLKVIFRTMHEMNGGRYPRASDPENFQKAWIHIRNLSRNLGLDQKNILFDMSINHRDMPSKGKPSQTATLIACDQENKFTTIEHKIANGTGYESKTIEKKIPKAQTKREKLRNKPIEYDIIGETIQIPYTIYDITTEEKQNCYTFEDYYPGDKYIDLMGVTFYNRGKAGYNRARYYPNKIINDKRRNTFDRLKSFNKPIFIDEVATTSVRYEGSYSQSESQKAYENNTEMKNKWLIYLKDFMINNPEILGMVYFNIDYTYGLSQRLIGEADWAIINLNNDKFYTGTYELYNNQNRNNQLYNLFQTDYLASSNKTKETIKIEINTNNKISETLAKKLKEKFGVEESVFRLKAILNIIDNPKIIKIVQDTINLLI